MSHRRSPSRQCSPWRITPEGDYAQGPRIRAGSAAPTVSCRHACWTLSTSAIRRRSAAASSAVTSRGRPSHRIVQVMTIRKMLIAATAAVTTACATVAPQDATWTAYGGNFGGGRYSDLRDIGPGNVARLEVAWTYHTGDASLEAADKGKAAFEATPIVVDGLLLGCSQGKPKIRHGLILS